MKQPSFEELLSRKEDLHSDLAPYVRETDAIGKVLQHPLMYEVPYNEVMNALINLRYQHKLKAICEARDAGDLNQIIALHERPWRWQALTDAASSMTDEQLAKAFAWVWIDSENIWQNRKEINSLIHRVNNPRLKASLMDKDDLEHFQNLPNTVCVYRGGMYRNKHGLSWTQDRDRAKWFAKRLARSADKTILITGYICKPEILFYTNGRGESEIIACDRSAVQIVNQELLP